MGIAATAAALLFVVSAFGPHAVSFTLIGVESGMHTTEREGIAKPSRYPPPEEENLNLVVTRGLRWNDDPNKVVATRRDAWRKSLDNEEAIRRTRLGPEYYSYKRMRDTNFDIHSKPGPRLQPPADPSSAEGYRKFSPMLPLISPSKPTRIFTHEGLNNSPRNQILTPRDPTSLRLPLRSLRPRILSREELPHQQSGRSIWKRHDSMSTLRARGSSKSPRVKEYQGIRGGSTAEDKASTSALPKSVPNRPPFKGPGASLEAYRAVAAFLPTFEDSITFKRKLQNKCKRPENGGKLPYPDRISISGLPNTGTNAMLRQLSARLDIRVTNGPARGIWKHIMPFHPEMERILTVNCSNWSPEWHAQLFMVRHPLTWIQAQTTRGTNFGSKCYGRSDCAFDACQPRPCKSGYDDPKSHKPPHTYMFPTLLDLWAAHATHVPNNRLPNALVVRYEDLLENGEAVVQRVAEHFGVRLKQVNDTEDAPLAKNARAWMGDKEGESHKTRSQQKWQNYKHFWRRHGIGVMSGGTGSDEQVGDPQPVVECEAIARMTARNFGALRNMQKERPGVLERALEMHGYQVPAMNQTIMRCTAL